MSRQTTSRLKLLACQLRIPKIVTPAERDLHLQNTAARIRRQLSKSAVDLVVLPELSSIDYAHRTFEQLHQLAEDEDGASFQVYSNIAKEFGVVIVYGYPGLSNGQYTICQAVVGADGQLIAVYEKLHLAHYGASKETDYFVRGNHLSVFELHGIRIAPIICYDIRFPELCRRLAVEHKVQLILHCGAYYRDESFSSWHPFAITRAVENQVYLLSLNRAGKHYGESLFCPPWMDENHPCITFAPQNEEFKFLVFDLQAIQEARKYPLLKDRLDDYSTL